MDYILICKCDVCRQSSTFEGSTTSTNQSGPEWISQVKLDFKQITSGKGKTMNLCNSCFLKLQEMKDKHDGLIAAFLRGDKNVD